MCSSILPGQALLGELALDDVLGRDARVVHARQPEGAVALHPATASTPSGAVCVWVTKSTLGFTEFFTQADGPEALNSAQAKGAADTVNLRASVEKLKS